MSLEVLPHLFMEEFEKDWFLFFSKYLEEFSSVAIWSWACFLGSFWLVNQCLVITSHYSGISSFFMIQF